MKKRIIHWLKKSKKPTEERWLTVIHAGYKVHQREIPYLKHKYDRTYYQAGREVLHEVGDYMNESELMAECEKLDDLIEALMEQAESGDI